jgi:CPA2 family monovalent cation:H+ antiporter-2
MTEPLSQVLILLAGAVLLVTLARRLAMPTTHAYLLLGLALGPHALGILPDSGTTRLLGDLGVAFLLFTLGLEFSLPRMIAMRHEVLGLGAAQVSATAALFALLAHVMGLPWLTAVVVGGAISLSSTALLLQQLTERAEINRSHGRLAFAMLLFQDLAFVPFLVLASGLASDHQQFTLEQSAVAVLGGILAVITVLAGGRWLLRPLFHEIAHSRLRELFTLAVLLVVLGAAWLCNIAGLSLALGAFLAGMMLAETEYRHQIDSVIRPFRDLLLGMFFVSVGMLLDLRLLASEIGLASLMLFTVVVLKAAVAALVTRPFTTSRYKALRTGIVISIGGEFGVALCTIALQGRLISPELGEPLLLALVLSMILSPVIVNNNQRVARFILREKGPPQLTAIEMEEAATQRIAQREHVILCGFGRVGQNVARVLESQGFEYIALDLDPARIRAARQAGDPVMFGDSADEEMLARAGLETASAVVVSFSDPATSVGILRSIRRLRPDVPVLVRTADDSRIAELQNAGATDVVPETFEASLMLVSHVLMLLRVPVSRVVRTIGGIRNDRYMVLRNIVRRGDARPLDDTHEHREEIKSVVVPPGAWAIGRTLHEVRDRGVEVTFTGIRRQGILGREPGGDTVLHDGDIVVIYGQPEALEHAESVLLAG